MKTTVVTLLKMILNVNLILQLLHTLLSDENVALYMILHCIPTDKLQSACLTIPAFKFSQSKQGCVLSFSSHLLNPEHLVVLLAGPISHNSIHLLIITTDFVTLY